MCLLIARNLPFRVRLANARVGRVSFAIARWVRDVFYTFLSFLALHYSHFTFKIFMRSSQRSSSPSSFPFGFVTELLATVRRETVGGHNFASWQVDFATITKRR